MKRLLVVTVLLMMWGMGSEADARRESLTPQQKEQLQKIQRIYLEALALTDRGQVDARWIEDMATRRLQELGYTVTTDDAQPHDVHVKMKCEQRKVWEGTTSSGGDADLPDSPLRAWKGPACQLTYFLNGKSTQWKKEVRTDFVDAIQAAAQAKAEDPGLYALDQLRLRLEAYDFPVRLTADWNQEDRLLTVLADSKSPPARKARVISLLGEMFSEKAAPQLVSSLKDPDSSVAAAAALALGNIGHQQSVIALVEMLKTGSTEMRIAAAKALGKLGALHGDASVIPPLLDALNTDDLALKTEVVWALGQIPDRRSYEPLLALQRSLRNVRTSDRSSQEGKLWDAVSYGLKQLDGFDQIN